jgi:hypothetical protein
MKTASVRTWSTVFSTLAICCFSIPAMALPLQEGRYRIGSKYIQIAARGNRLCYQGLSARGNTTSSITPHTSPDFYVVNFKTADSKETLVLHQPTIGNLLYGTLHNLASWAADYESSRSQNDAMERCLGSQSPFLEESTSSR